MAFESKVIKSDASTTIATIAVDTVSGVDYPVSQLIVGADGGSKSLVTGSTGLPVDLVAGSALTALQLIDDVVHVDDAAFTLGSSKGVVMMGFAGTQSVNANDAAALACDTDGALHIADGGNSITVDGTVTANLSATDNAVLDTIDAVLDTIKTDTASSLTALQLIDDAVYTDGSGTPSKGVLMMGSDATNPQALLCSPTGIGYRTIVTSDGSYSPVFQDDAAIGNEAVMLAGFVFDDGSPDSVDEGDAGYARMSANRNLYVNIRDNAGNERGLNIDASGNLSAKLAANSGVDIGDVDVTSIVPGTAATNLGKAQDSAAGGTDTGVAAMAIRDDEVSTLGADGDYVNLVADEFRRLRVTNMPSSTSEVKFAKIDGASSGDNTLVAAAGGGIKIRVLQYVIVSAGTVSVRFESGASGTALTGQMNLVANTGVSSPFCPEGLFETADNALLNMELSDAISVDGHLTYVEI